MFHIVSKILTFFLMPAGIIFILLIYAISTKNRTKSKKIIIVTLFFFYLFTNPFLVNEILLLWEIPPTAISTVKPHDIGIILTGNTINTTRQPAENIYLTGTSDRIGQTLQLYKLGKIKKILISGGDVPILRKTTTREIDQIARYLILNGVTRKDIYLEDRSTNTHENAVNTSKILKKQFPDQSYILITSGFHLRRAIGCFKKVGVKLTPYGANYVSSERQWVLTYFLPSGHAIGYLQLTLREIIGYITYWVFGWI
ncbi:YdcF family protein [Emticicia sp. BO119]|uniref:YdcF family protein n=1 Tax=Emticicia sp. BO119 TaxID=2757768 RepID=UPI0015EFEE18|nr:YdcF family protein [Emticicia sp. BO119]MBA4852621.1 YdcF family protein [Emticicia sp. BO119]